MWSHDGRLLAYTSERNDREDRELWVFDTAAGRESRVATEEVGRPIDWSPDGAKLLVAGANNPRLSIVDRATGRTSLVGLHPRARWLPEGIACEGQQQVLLQDAVTGRVVRALDFSASANTASGWRTRPLGHLRTRQRPRRAARCPHRRDPRMADPGATQFDRQFLHPHARVAYLASRHDVRGEVQPDAVERRRRPAGAAAGAPPEAVTFEGWTADGASLLVTRWTAPVGRLRRTDSRTLWRVPTTGGAPSSTGLVMEGLRDTTLHPDGRQIAFNAGWKGYKSWVLQGVLDR